MGIVSVSFLPKALHSGRPLVSKAGNVEIADLLTSIWEIHLYHKSTKYSDNIHIPVGSSKLLVRCA